MLKKILKVARVNTLSDIRSLLKKMDSDVTVSEILESIEILLDKQILPNPNSHTMTRNTKLICSKCGNLIRVFPVNSTNKDQIGGTFKSVKMCSSKACMHCEYTDSTVSEIMRGK